MTDPRTIEELVREERWRQRALDRAAGAQPESPPENETGAAALTRRWTEQERAERRDEELVRRVQNENPNAPTRATRDDPLRAVAQAQRAARRRRRRRLPR